jgi:transcription initiation factor TFIIIB Brf1 subunit/transcription initiation factor TFIIB
MPWDRSAPADPKYRSKAHRDERAKYVRQMQRDGYLVCAQPVCVMGDRTIHQGERWCAGHDDTGTRYIGPVHHRCNERDAAVRANARSHTATRWKL